ncbi:MAG TPA: hypothetical protein ENJ82_04975, partial [Bacteroidetes bacterium]|nr:hypothetical protein [Bacteroidota bacterium]
MKNLLAFPEALVAVLKTQPNMKNYVPSKLKAGSRGGTWVGLFRNWAPTYAGTVLCKAVSETVLDLHINVTQVFPGKHDLEIRLTGPGSAELTYKNTGETITMQVKATPGSIIYRHKTGFTI